MKKKTPCHSEENVSAHTVRMAEVFKRNPRLPHKVKSNKSSSPTVRTVGQLSSGGKSVYQTATFGRPHVLRQETESRPAAEDMPWSKLYRTFSNGRNTNGPTGTILEGDDYCAEEKCHFWNIVSEDPLEDPSPTRTPVDVKGSTDTGVQVDLFHCKECRRHIKYGKHFNTSCTESESESNLYVAGSCHACESKMDLRISYEEEAEDVKRCEQGEDSPKAPLPPTPGSEVSTQNDENSTRDPVKISRLSLLLQKTSENYLLLIRLMFLATFVVSLLVYVTDLKIGVTIAKVVFYVRYLMGYEEVEEPSFLKWCGDFLFGVCTFRKPSLIVALF